MRKSISIITATAMVAAPIVTMASPLTVQMNVEIQQNKPQQEEHSSQEEQQRHRQVKSGKGTGSSSSSSSHDEWGPPPPGWNNNGWHAGIWSNHINYWSSSSSSSGKSGKSGGGKSGKSGSGGGSGSSSSSDDWHGNQWSAPPGWWGGHSSSHSSSSSGKSGKSGGGKSGKSGSGSSSSSSSSYDGWHGHGNGNNWAPIPGWWGKPDDSSSSSSSGKSGKSGGSKGGKGSKDGSSSSSSSHDGWYGPAGWGDNDGWNTHGDWGHDSHGHWHWTPKPWKPSSSSSSHSKSGKSKSSKGASSSSSSSSPDGYYHYHVHEHEDSSSSSRSSTKKTEKTERSFKPDSASSGICASHFNHGGLDCSIDHDFSYCTEPGSNAECGSGHSCYDKQLCPQFSSGAQPPTGVCDTHGAGLECDHVTTYCTEPGGNGECGAGRKCHDAGLCGYGSGTYEGVCGMALHGGEHSGLDCEDVSTMCTGPGEFAECAHGAKCFGAGLCRGGDGHAGFCSSEHGFDCDETTKTHCARPGEGGQCPHGEKCFDVGVCAPTRSPVKKEKETPVPTPSPTVLALKEFCFHEGEVVDCAGYSWGGDSWANDGYGDSIWGADGHGDDDKNGDDDNDEDDDGDGNWSDDEHKGDAINHNGDDDNDEDDDDGHKGDAISVPYTYTIDTNGKVKPEEMLTPVENAMLEDVAKYIEDNEEYKHFSGRITATPGDELADDEYCGDGNAIRCSVVKGAMSIYVSPPAWDGDGQAPEGWAGDGHSKFDQCEALQIIKKSMEGNDYSEVEGVTDAVYRDSELKCEREKIIGGANLVIQPQEDDTISAAAAFGILFAAAALIALAFLAARKRRRQPQPVEVMKDDISLISNSLDGSLYEHQEDPYANTIDVHKCTSIYCNCNGAGGDTTFLPAPKKADMAKTLLANGISPTSVGHANEDGFFNQEEKEEEEYYALEHQAADVERQASNESRGSIMRVPILSHYEQNEGRPLTPVNEIAHDSEIDTELESLADFENDQTTVPPPPPLAFHPAYRQDSGDVHMTESTDEISI